MKTTTTIKLNLSEIITDAALQARKDKLNKTFVMNSLAPSIMDVGLEHPIEVGRYQGAYYLINGYHRFGAYDWLNQQKATAGQYGMIDAVVTEYADEDDMVVAALMANVNELPVQGLSEDDKKTIIARAQFQRPEIVKTFRDEAGVFSYYKMKETVAAIVELSAEAGKALTEAAVQHWVKAINKDSKARREVLMVEALRNGEKSCKEIADEFAVNKRTVERRAEAMREESDKMAACQNVATEPRADFLDSDKNEAVAFDAPSINLEETLDGFNYQNADGLPTTDFDFEAANEELGVQQVTQSETVYPECISVQVVKVCDMLKCVDGNITAVDVASVAEKFTQNNLKDMAAQLRTLAAAFEKV
ncbi:ParB/RepB/Spo0J family partition protein [Vibrio campbellii]|uniref:ParB/RepB/Spo0J family partition protein n=1 Tax=Vibrio campbellii TaxID=680 RepID=UPI0005EFC96B|nr:ParB/RepB/Spo0J family partition protein [Vibrio campbellii]